MPLVSERISTDFLIIGGGVAGLRSAIELDRHGRVLTVMKDAPTESSTEYAQGGVAVALSDEDEISIHFDDTIRAGDGLCRRNAVSALVAEGPARILELIAWGAEFDRDGTKLSFTQEAAHSKRRILHAHGDSTGREILRVLGDKARTSANITKLDFAFTCNLLVERGRCVGAIVLQREPKRLLVITARAVILATGGAGQLYARTTNPAVSTGDGMAMAYRAGAALVDMEFVQFHPTALFRKGAPQFLLSEAMRGEGGMLRNVQGRRFMDDYHPARELAPRDVVTRAITAEMARTCSDHVLLDMTHLTAEYLVSRFPRIYATCLEHGIDITRMPIPVSPAAHYIMGGVRTDLRGATSVPGLFAAGETACTGVHGANRLASNSLLEGLVFGARAGQAAAEYAARRRQPAVPDAAALAAICRRRPSLISAARLDRMRRDLRSVLWENVGIIRDRKGLTAALRQLRSWDSLLKDLRPDRRMLELKNMVTVALLITRSALARRNSVGAHFRSDHPGKGKDWRSRTTLRRSKRESR